MSLGRLLAAGKSLVGLSAGESRYRTDKKARLPKFISPKNPFATADETAEPARIKPPQEKLAAAKPVAAPMRTAVAKPGEKVSRQRVGARAVKWAGELRKRLNPLTRLPRLRGPARSVAPPPTRSEQQGELSLDKVMVVRNDLSDTDFEVVKPTAAKSVSPMIAMTAEKLEPVGAAWSRLTAKFFGDD